jgi:hypothetical protein
MARSPSSRQYYDLRGMAVFHRHQSRGTDQVCLLDTDSAQFIIIILVAKKGKNQFKPTQPTRDDMTDCQGVLDLLHD